MKIRDKIQKFMYGRYGTDNLNQFLSIIYLIVFIIYIFLNRYFPINLILLIFIILLMVLTVYRTLSKKIVKRQIENDRYLKIESAVFKPFRRLRNRIKDRKTHLYKKCPSCKQTLRLQRIKGEHTVRCPICNNKFNIKVKR